MTTPPKPSPLPPQTQELKQTAGQRIADQICGILGLHLYRDGSTFKRLASLIDKELEPLPPQTPKVVAQTEKKSQTQGWADVILGDKSAVHSGQAEDSANWDVLSKWPQCPWPEDVWPTTIEEAGELMRKKLGDHDTTAISGSLMRYGWQLANAVIVAHLVEHGFLPKTEVSVTSPKEATPDQDLGESQVKTLTAQEWRRATPIKELKGLLSGLTGKDVGVDNSASAAFSAERDDAIHYVRAALSQSRVPEPESAPTHSNSGNALSPKSESGASVASTQGEAKS